MCIFRSIPEALKTDRGVPCTFYVVIRDENLPLFRGFPLFLSKFAEINCVKFDPTCSNLMHFEGGRG